MEVEYLDHTNETEGESVSTRLLFPKGDGIVLVRADAVEVEEIEWLWHPYVPLSKLTILDGDPGIGKSNLCSWLASQVTQGAGGVTPGRAVLLCAEEGISDSVAPRMLKLGADMKRLYVSEFKMTLDMAGIKKLDGVLKEVQPKLLVVDTIPFYMGAKLDLNKSNEVGAITGALGELAKRYRCAVVLIRHLRKAESNDDLYRGQGSMYWIGSARSALLVTKDKDGRCYMKHIKSNLSAKGVSLEYEIDKEGVFSWVGEYKEGVAVSKERLSTLKMAKEFLVKVLEQGPCYYGNIMQAAEEAGISPRTILRAKELLGTVQSYKDKDGWIWRLQPLPQDDKKAALLREAQEKLRGRG